LIFKTEKKNPYGTKKKIVFFFDFSELKNIGEIRRDPIIGKQNEPKKLVPISKKFVKNPDSKFGNKC
jgi:hypothetical protein